MHGDTTVRGSVVEEEDGDGETCGVGGGLVEELVHGDARVRGSVLEEEDDDEACGIGGGDGGGGGQ